MVETPYIPSPPLRANVRIIKSFQLPMTPTVIEVLPALALASRGWRLTHNMQALELDEEDDDLSDLSHTVLYLESTGVAGVPEGTLLGYALVSRILDLASCWPQLPR